MAMRTAKDRPSGNVMVARYLRAHKRPCRKRHAGLRCLSCPGGMQVRRCRMLGAPGRTGTAHIMQFGPIGIEGPVEELVPEGADVGEQTGFANSSRCRGGVRF